LLHDAIEDCDVPVKIIADTFGTDVADLVGQVTDDKTMPKEERKKRQVESAGGKYDRAKILKLADKASNIRALVSSPAADWSVQRKIDYIEWGRQVVEGFCGVLMSISRTTLITRRGLLKMPYADERPPQYGQTAGTTFRLLEAL
jgi:GTP diphosphokinase / guanosine-3',5'-bis(diphosphate) 3'-diphosphatase